MAPDIITNGTDREERVTKPLVAKGNSVQFVTGDATIQCQCYKCKISVFACKSII